MIPLLVSLLLSVAAPAAEAAPPSFLSGFDASQMTCGRRGYTFPVLIGGQYPISACILKFRSNRPSAFGSMDF